MARRSMPYTLDAHIIASAAEDRAAGLAFFLMENTGSIFGEWFGTMKAADQRKLFGFVIGKGKIYIRGEDEYVGHSVMVCFGTMSDTVWSASFGDLCNKEFRDYPHIHRYA